MSKRLANSVSELYSTGKRWCQFNIAVTKDGDKTGIYEANAYQFCIEGALDHVYNTPRVSGRMKLTDETQEWKLARERLVKALKKLHPKHKYLADFNDCADTTIEQVQELVREANV
jgi:hypothetical protein